jgi:undecaprenyl-diphosphatase
MSPRQLNFFSAFSLSTAIAVLYHQAWGIAQTSIPSPTVEAVETVAQTHINLFQAFVLGFVQGATEFLPISSTAHLKVIPIALGWGDPGVAFTAIIQLGSVVAVLWYFWGDLLAITQGITKAVQTKKYDSLEFKLGLGIGLGTLPIIFFGLLMKIFIKDLDHSPLRSLTTIAIVSIVMALLLALAEKLGTHRRPFEKLRWQDGVTMGLAQALALIPGVSRSGSTLTAGLFINLERAAAARFSFLLGIPAITIAGLVELKGVLDADLGNDVILPIIVGTISAAVFSYLAIAWLIKFLQKRSTWIFVWYRLAFGIIILLGLAGGFRE